MLKRCLDFLSAEVIGKTLLLLSAISGTILVLMLGYLLLSTGAPHAYQGKVDFTVNNACLIGTGVGSTTLKDGQSVTFSIGEDELAEVGFMNGRLEFYRNSWGSIKKFVDLNELDQATVIANITGRYGDTINVKLYWCRGVVFFNLVKPRRHLLFFVFLSLKYLLCSWKFLSKQIPQILISFIIS